MDINEMRKTLGEEVVGGGFISASMFAGLSTIPFGEFEEDYDIHGMMEEIELQLAERYPNHQSLSDFPNREFDLCPWTGLQQCFEDADIPQSVREDPDLHAHLHTLTLETLEAKILDVLKPDEELGRLFGTGPFAESLDVLSKVRNFVMAHLDKIFLRHGTDLRKFFKPVQR